MSRIEDAPVSRRIRQSRRTVVSIGAATHIGAALRAAKRNAAPEELERHLEGLRSLDQNDLSIILVMQWLEEQLRSRLSGRRSTQHERRRRGKMANSGQQPGGDA